MPQKLVIVESPKKAQLIQGFLAQNKLTGYKVMASAGHVRDLKKRPLGIDLEDNYRPIYEITEDKAKLVRELKAEAKKSELVYLASDEDREGEAIAWHLSEALALKPQQVKRIAFHEITSEAFLEALDNPRDIDHHLVDAQQARRVLDRLVGYELSPVLWKRVRPSLSAGRVQSVAVRLVVEREREIQAFVPSSQYRVQAEFLLPQGQLLKAELNHRFDSEEEAHNFLLKCKSQGDSFKILDLKKKQGKRSPSAPFTTSTLQQEAASRLGYSVTTTMRLAQSLYEGGHITYMRTDSVNLSKLALGTIAKVIKDKYGDEYHQSRQYATKSKGAQEAHEAIRPTYADRTKIEGTAQEQKLYELIRNRALASQMADAIIERTSVVIPVEHSEYAFIATGEVVVFRGFLELYLKEEGAEAKMLPPMNVGETLQVQAIVAQQRYSARPARYTEASMVSKMEELGIGRPSTYAPTIQTIQTRGYVERGDKEGEQRSVIELQLALQGVKRSVKEETYGADKGKLIPTDMGIIVNDFLIEHFPSVVNYGFTAEVESDFDQIAEGKRQWQAVIDEFYKDFHPLVSQAETYAPGQARIGARELGRHPETGQRVVASMGRFGSMVQIGTTEDGDTPRYASLRPGQSLEAITLDEALELFRLPKLLGEYEGKEVSVAVGRFGPYIKHNSQFVSLPKGVEPLDVDLTSAIQYIEEKRLKEERSLLRTFTEESELEIRDGRYGAYIKYKGDNYKLPKGADIDSLSYAEVKQLIEQGDTKSKTSKRKTNTARTRKAKA